MEKKQILMLLLSVVIISVVFISCSAEKDSNIDLADIETMNIGAEMPEILYGDDEKIILHGTFGILTYNYKELKVIDIFK